MRLSTLRTAAARMLLAAIVLVPAAPTPTASVPVPDAVARGVAYLVTRQQPSGAFYAASATADAVAEAAAVVAAFGGPRSSVDAAMRYVGEHGPARARHRGGHAARIVLGIVAAGRDPRAHAGTDYVAALRAHRSALTGTYDTGVYANALAVLGAAAAGVPLEERTYDYFRLSACSDGGLSHEAGCVQRPDVDTTAMTVLALRAAGRAPTDPVVAGARRFLLDARNASGGWGLEASEPTNANSTGLALSALAALGEDPSRAPWRDGRRDPLRALRALQLPDGAFAYLDGQPANDYATVQALPGLAGARYPLRASPTTSTAARRASAPAAEAGTRTVRAQPAPSSPAAGASAGLEPEASKSARIGRSLGDRSTGAGARTAALWISLLAGATMIAIPLIARRRRRT